MDNIIHFQVEEQEVDYRLDKYLFNKLTDFSFSRSFIQKLIKDKFVFVDGREAKSNCKLKYGQNIEVVMPQPKETEILPENIPLDVLYEDSDLLIVNKPKNMVVHPSKGHITGTLVNAVMFHCKDSLSGINGEIRPGIVHRIDKDTTGSLIICKNDETHIAIAEQIKVHSVKRIYHGILLGHLKEPEGKVEGNIGRHPTDRKKMAIVPEGKSAITHYRVIREFSNASYVEFQLETGRTHQIRVHMASIGHPLLGDVLYGSQKNPYHLAGQALHAMTIGFIHPKTGEYMEVSAPLPEYFEKLLLTLDRS